MCCCWRRIEKIKCSEKITNEVLERIGGKRTHLNNILHRKANLIGPTSILKTNDLLHNVIEGGMKEVKGAGRRRTQLLDDLSRRKLKFE
jgi:hypothetical protein